jgi:hypothetical protein
VINYYKNVSNFSNTKQKHYNYLMLKIASYSVYLLWQFAMPI